MSKLKTIKIKVGAIKLIKERFSGISERSIYYYLKGPQDVELRSEAYRQTVYEVRKYARQFERK